MSSKYILALVCAAAVSLTACKKNEGGENTAADTTTVPGQDTVNVPTAVPTTDTVVKTTTTEVDTVHGDAKDTTKH